MAITFQGGAEAQRAYRNAARGVGTAALRGTLAGGYHILGYMKSNMLSGQRLRVRTGKLRSNWRVRPLGGVEGSEAARSGESDVVGVAVTTNTRYAPPHEYGFRGIVQVREHDRAQPDRERSARRRRQAEARVRRLGPRGKVRARAAVRREREDRARRRATVPRGFGSHREFRAVKLAQRRARGIQGFPSAREGQAAPGRVRVAAHPRFVKMPARRFLRDSVLHQGDRALAIVAETIRRSVGG